MKKEKNNLWLAIIGAIGVVLLFLCLFSTYSCGNSKSNKQRTVICTQGTCDTINTEINYYTSGCLSYELDSSQIFVCGTFTIEKIK